MRRAAVVGRQHVGAGADVGPGSSAAHPSSGSRRPSASGAKKESGSKNFARRRCWGAAVSTYRLYPTSFIPPNSVFRHCCHQASPLAAMSAPMRAARKSASFTSTPSAWALPACECGVS